MRRIVLSLTTGSLLLLITTGAPAQSGGWDKIQAMKASQVLYVHSVIVIQTLYRFTNTGSETFRPSGKFGFEFYLPEGAEFISLMYGNQNVNKLDKGQSKNHLSLPSGIPPGQSFMRYSIAVPKGADEKITIRDRAVYDAFKEINLYWEDKTLKVKSTGFKPGDVGDGMFMGKAGFRKVKVNYGNATKPVELTFAGGTPISMGGGGGGESQAKQQRGGPITITNKYWISSTSMAVALLLVILIGGGMIYWAKVANIKPVFGPTIRHYERKRDKLLSREKLTPDEEKKLAILEAYLKNLKQKD